MFLYIHYRGLMTLLTNDLLSIRRVPTAAARNRILAGVAAAFVVAVAAAEVVQRPGQSRSSDSSLLIWRWDWSKTVGADRTDRERGPGPVVVGFHRRNPAGTVAFVAVEVGVAVRTFVAVGEVAAHRRNPVGAAVPKNNWNMGSAAAGVVGRTDCERRELVPENRS